MKILLVGELSGFHNNLKKGLIELGHQVSIAGTGDGWKGYPVDVDFSVKDETILNRVYKSIKPLTKIQKLSGFDIVQFATPLLFNPWVNYYYYKLLNQINNGNSYLCAISSNDPYYLESTSHFKYSPYQDFEPVIKLRYYPRFSKKDLQSHNNIIGLVKSVIPSCYDYQFGYLYKDYPRLNNIIPFPFNVDDVRFVGNKRKGKIVLFHGISRAKNKGSSYIVSALNKAKSKYPNEIDIQIVKKVPYSKYIDLVNNANVLFDQCLSYSYGYNALIGLAKGKIVMSGAEEIAINSLDLETKCPVINIMPDENQILQKIEEVIQEKRNIEIKGEASRSYLERHHNSSIIAATYLKSWKSKK